MALIAGNIQQNIISATVANANSFLTDVFTYINGVSYTANNAYNQANYAFLSIVSANTSNIEVTYAGNTVSIDTRLSSTSAVSPGGALQSLQFNSNGTFAGDANLIFTPYPGTSGRLGLLDTTRASNTNVWTQFAQADVNSSYYMALCSDTDYANSHDYYWLQASGSAYGSNASVQEVQMYADQLLFLGAIGDSNAYVLIQSQGNVNIAAVNQVNVQANLTVTGNITLDNTDVTSWITGSYNQANAAYGQANAALAQAQNPTISAWLNGVPLSNTANVIEFYNGTNITVSGSVVNVGNTVYVNYTPSLNSYITLTSVTSNSMTLIGPTEGLLWYSPTATANSGNVTLIQGGTTAWYIRGLADDYAGNTTHYANYLTFNRQAGNVNLQSVIYGQSPDTNLTGHTFYGNVAVSSNVLVTGNLQANGVFSNGNYASFVAQYLGNTSGVGIGMSGGIFPGIGLLTRNGAANSNTWDIVATTSNTVQYRTVNDGYTAANTYLTATRSGLSITNMSYGDGGGGNTSHVFNGNASFQWSLLSQQAGGATPSNNVTVPSDSTTQYVAAGQLPGWGPGIQFGAGTTVANNNIWQLGLGNGNQGGVFGLFAVSDQGAILKTALEITAQANSMTVSVPLNVASTIKSTTAGVYALGTGNQGVNGASPPQASIGVQWSGVGSGLWMISKASANANQWSISNDSAGNFRIDAWNDGITGANTVFEVTRSGAVPTGITLGDGVNRPPVYAQGGLISYGGAPYTVNGSSSGASVSIGNYGGSTSNTACIIIDSGNPTTANTSEWRMTWANNGIMQWTTWVDGHSSANVFFQVNRSGASVPTMMYGDQGYTAETEHLFSGQVSVNTGPLVIHGASTNVPNDMANTGSILINGGGGNGDINPQILYFYRGTGVVANSSLWDHYIDGANMYHRVLNDLNSGANNYLVVTRANTQIVSMNVGAITTSVDVSNVFRTTTGSLQVYGDATGVSGGSNNFYPGMSLELSTFQAGGFTRILSYNRASGGQVAPLQIQSSNVTFPGIATTSCTAPTAILMSSGNNAILRSSSSIRYKTNIEPMWANVSTKIYDMNPVWFRSNTETTVDPADISFYGFIAEEVANLDCRFVHWIADANGVNVPEGVAYASLVVPIIAEMKKMKTRMDTMESEIEALKAQINNKSNT